MKTENSLYEIRIEMWRRGGEFVRSLSQTLGAADLENKDKIVATFPNIIAKYDGFASITKRQQTELLNKEDDEG